MSELDMDMVSRIAANDMPPCFTPTREAFVEMANMVLDTYRRAGDELDKMLADEKRNPPIGPLAVARRAQQLAIIREMFKRIFQLGERANVRR